MSRFTRAEISDRKNYKFWTSVSLRYGDTDKLGHINNAVFATICEAGRCELLFNRDGSIAPNGQTIVLANLNIDFLAEMHFPGVAEVGTALESIGKASMKFVQCIYKDGVCCGTSHSTIVFIDDETRRSVPISDECKKLVERTAPFRNALLAE